MNVSAAMGNIFWIFIIFMVVFPLIQRRLVETQRFSLIRKIERLRGSRVITLIHRQELMSFFGIPIYRYINIDDSEEVLRAIRLTPDDMPIDMVLHTPGGLVLATEQIADALSRHPAKVTIFVPHYAMSGGTLIALSADEVVMDENAVLGPVDPQLGEYPAASLIKAVSQKEKKDLEDRTLILADVAEKAMRQIYQFVLEKLSPKMERSRAEEVAQMLTDGRWTHDYPITFEMAKELGIPVSKELPIEVYRLMELYPQPSQRRPSVQYIPVPYRKDMGGRQSQAD